MSKKELDEAIYQMVRPVKLGFKSEPINVLPLEQQGEALCFNIRGEWTDDEEKCAAKRVKTQQGVRYFAKWCLEGPDKGHLLNPYSVYFREGDDIRLEQRRGRLRYEFKVITATAFENYVKFLQTRTYSFCQAAEREILNG